MDKLAKIRKYREDRFFEKRMRRAAHDKKEIIKKDLIRHEQLISDPIIRAKIEKLREVRDEKRQLEKEKKMAKKINVGIEDIMDVDAENNKKNQETEKPKNPRKILTVKKQMKLRQKEKLIARRKIFKKK